MQLAVTVTELPSFLSEGLLDTARTVGDGPVLVAPELQAQSVASAMAAAVRHEVVGAFKESSTVATAGSSGRAAFIAVGGAIRQNKCKTIR
jgi:hypothetical protein